jgi:hypothetical protein
MKTSLVVLFVLAMAAAVMAGCAQPGAHQAVPPPSSQTPQEFELSAAIVAGSSVHFFLSQPIQGESLQAVSESVRAYNSALERLDWPSNGTGGFEDYSKRFKAITGALEEDKSALVAALEATKHRPSPYPSWREVEAAVQAVERHYQQVLDSAGKGVESSYQQEVRSYDETRRSMAGMMVLYALPAVPVVAFLGWFLTRSWERKQRYWGSFTSQKLFSDPRLMMLGLAAFGLAAIGIGLLALEVMIGGVGDFISFLLPW